MKPEKMEVKVENIPKELIEKNQWIVWKWEQGDGKWTKPPYSPTNGEFAKSTDRNTWATFKVTLEAYYNGGDWDGIGFMLTPPYCGIDWDSVIKETGELHGWVLRYLKSINSYSEYSPSGKGVKTLCKATLPKGGHHDDKVGIFQNSRYFCITGHTLPGVSSRIEERQKEIDSLIKERWPGDFQKEEKDFRTGKIDDRLQLWQSAQREISKHSRIMLHWMIPKPDDRSGHDWHLVCLCLEEGITDPGILYQIILHSPCGKAQSYPNTDKYITDLISRAINQGGIIQKDSTEFPFSIVSGIAGDFADLYSQYIEAPKEYLFTGFLCSLGSILAGKVSVRSELRFDTNLYIVFLGDSATERKSSSIEAPIGFFHEFFPNVLQTCWGVGSAEGLQVRLKNSEQGRLLLALDEMDGFVNKCKIQGSVLLQASNILFEKTHYENTTKDSKVIIDNAHLSILGATTKAIYDRLWDERFIRIGFVNRIFLVPGRSEVKFPIPQKIPIEEKNSLAKRTAKILSQVGEGLSMEISREAKSEFNEWYFSIRGEDTEHAKRLDTYALRFMPLLALNDGKDEIDLETTQKAITLLNWQKNVRETFDPIDSTNEVARTEERVRRLLKKNSLSTRDLKRGLHIERLGVWFFNKAIANLSEGFDKEIHYNHGVKKWTLL
jgi:hypothetical protein